jgi:hypothetical protein
MNFVFECDTSVSQISQGSRPSGGFKGPAHSSGHFCRCSAAYMVSFSSRGKSSRSFCFSQLHFPRQHLAHEGAHLPIKGVYHQAETGYRFRQTNRRRPDRPPRPYPATALHACSDHMIFISEFPVTGKFFVISDVDVPASGASLVQ